ncbi:hypothetical protein BDW62DRAFT_13552 [Aspergillus aurantiobrunneus]
MFSLFPPNSVSSLSERFTRSYLAVDDRISTAPTQALLLAGDGDIFIEWTYTIDLDRELLAVDKAVFFNLPKLPHYPSWHQYLTEDHRGRRVLDKNTPSDLIGVVVDDIEVDHKLRARFNSFDLETKIPEILGSFKSTNVSRVKLLTKAISAACRKYRALIDGFYLEWESNSFPFKQLAFAILSIAAGEVAFKSLHDLNASYDWEGFFLIPNAEYPDGQQALLPRFLRECHHPGADSGSVPRSNPFWLGNTLVYLTPRTDLAEVEEVAIATVVNSGLSQGLASFHALVFSVLDLILIRVKRDGNMNVRVIRSPLVNMLYFDDDTSAYPNGP